MRTVKNIRDCELLSKTFNKGYVTVTQAREQLVNFALNASDLDITNVVKDLYWITELTEVPEEYCQYDLGLEPPNYPVPAIPSRAVWGRNEMWGTIRIEQGASEDPEIVAIYDELFDRCLDFGTPYMEFYSPELIEYISSIED